MIESIVSILTIILFLLVLWITLYFTWGITLSGRDSSVMTTHVIFLCVLGILTITGVVIWLILKTLSFI